MLLNSDVVLTSDIVTPLLAALHSDEAVAVVAPRLVYEDGEVQTSSERFPDLRFELARSLRGTKLGALVRPVFDVEHALRAARAASLEPSDAACDAEFLWATCWLLRKRDVDHLGLFDESFVTYDEDLDFCRRLARSGRRAVYVPAVSLVHLGGRSSTSSRKRQLQRTGRWRYYRRHHGLAAATAYRVLTSSIDGMRALNARRRSLTDTPHLS
jgi:GT2 family glycosyltransferase